MTAAVPRRASPARDSTLKLLFAATTLCAAAPAAAQVAASLSIFSDARYRGYSLSAGRPVATADLSRDDPSGFYAGLSASAVLGSDDAVKPLALQLNGGYARRLSSGLGLDFGIIHSSYSRYSGSASATSYSEVYAGVSRNFLSARVAFSPHYFERGAKTLYGEVDANVSPLRKLHLDGHVGLLIPIGYREQRENSRAQYDWRLGVARELGGASVHMIWTGGGPGRDYYGGHSRSRNALVFGVSYVL